MKVIRVLQKGELVYERLSKVSDLDASDGYHTISELYRYRMLYNAGFANAYQREYATKYDTTVKNGAVKSWRHSDGELPFGKENYFVVVINLPTGQISNHYEGKWWDLFDVPEVDRAPEFDGHTPAQAAKRLEDYLRVSAHATE